MQTVSKSYLKTHMLRLFRQVEKEGAELVVTDNNRPVLKIVPFAEKQSVADVFGDVRGNVGYNEDINAPTAEEWGEV